MTLKQVNFLISWHGLGVKILMYFQKKKKKKKKNIHQYIITGILNPQILKLVLVLKCQSTLIRICDLYTWATE